MKIQVLGSGCKSCDALYENVLNAMKKCQLGENTRLEKINDIDYFQKMGVFTTPALVIEGELIFSGKALAEEALIEILNSRK